MNAHVRPEDLSPPGEVSARLYESLPGDSANYDPDGILKILHLVLHLSQNGIGAISCVAELLRDLKCGVKSNPGLGEWVDALDLCKKQLEQTGAEPKDRLLIASTHSGPSRILLTPFGNHLSNDTKVQLRQIRASVILRHMSQRQPISEKLSRLFSQLNSGDSECMKNLAMAILFDRNRLNELRSKYAPESDIAEFITSLISSIDTPVASPPTIRAQQIAPVVTTNRRSGEDGAEVDDGDGKYREQTSDEQNTGSSSSEEINDQPTTFQEPIRSFLWETEHASPRDFSGIPNLWDYLQPSELESVCKLFVDALNGPNNNESLAAFLAIFTRTSPNKYRSLLLCKNKQSGLWLDLNAGHICWELEAVIDRKRWLKRDETWVGRAPIRIPFPAEITARLQHLFNINPAAANLGDLFGGNLSALESSTRHYLKSISKTSHRITLGRLCNSYARYLLNLCKDEAYACIQGLDFRIGTQSNINYCTFRATRINSISNEAYRQLGLSGAIESPATIDVGSRFIGRIDAVNTILAESLREATEAYAHVKNRHDAASLATAHTIISKSLLRVMCIVTGHRESDCHSFANHTIDLELGLAILADKNVSIYHHTRLVPIPALAVRWINFYFKWLELIRYRFLRINRKVSQLADSIISSRNKRADAPLFFSLHADGETKGLCNEDISDLFTRHSLKANAGRHWTDNILRDVGCDSAVLMAWSGHSNIGQEAYGVRSALDPMSVCNAIRKTIDSHLDLLSLQDPPSLKPRKCPFKFNHQHDYVPGGLGVDLPKMIVAVYPLVLCPFREFSLSYSRHFLDMCKQWLSTAQTASIGTVAISLVVRDGIANKPELMAAVSEVLWGRIFQNGNEFFVDTNTQELGIRRVWLDPVTIRLVSKIVNTKPSNEELIYQTRSAFLDLTKRSGIAFTACPIDEVLKRARAFYSLRLPGIVRGWGFGEVHARTSRPETLARHLYHLVEHPGIERGKCSRKSKILGTDKFITEAILNASDKTRNKGREETRLRNLLNDLSEFEDKPLKNGLTEVLLKYALHLSRNLKSPASVERYYYGLRSFIADNCRSLDSLDDFDEIEWDEPVNEFRNLRVAASEDGNDPELTALNHFLDCMGIDRVILRYADPARSARRYADYPSKNEVNRALQIIPGISSLSQTRTDQAQVALEALAYFYLRWFEVSRLRVTDIAPTELASIVITHESVGTHKTINADRVHTEIESKLANKLSELSQLRRKQFESRDKTFLFCDATNSTCVSDETELHHLLSDALWAVTGSDYLSVHGCRRLIPISLFRTFLDPDLRANMSPLSLRQSLFTVTGNIGHGDPLTTVGNYICGLDEVRRKWVNVIFREAGISTSPIFFASIVNKPADTLRARLRRKSLLAQTNPLEDFDPKYHEALRIRIRPLPELLVKDTNQLSIDPREVIFDDALSCSTYTAARLLKTEKTLAAFSSQISQSNQKRIERGLARIADAHGKSWSANLSILPSTLLNDDLFVSASNSFAHISINIGAALAVCRAISSPDKAWEISKFDDTGIISFFLDHLDRSKIEVVVSRTKSKLGDVNTFLALPSIKYKHRQLNPRWFPRGCKLRFQFIPRGTSNEALPSKAPLTTFFISAIVISRCAFLIGGNHE